MRRALTRRRGHAYAGAAGAAWLGLYAAFVGLEPGGERGVLVFADTAYLVPIACASGLAALAARRAAPGRGAFWTLVALANGVWLAGEILWSVRELRSGSVPFPWWTDAAYLSFYALMAVALYAAFRPRLRAIGVAQLLDGALVVGALALVWWWAVLRPLPLGGDLGSVVAVAGPAAALLLTGMLVAMRFLPVRQGTLGTTLVAAGLVCATVSDAVYTHAVVTNGYLSGGWLELGWQAEAILYSLGALAAARGFDARPSWVGRRDHQKAGAALLVSAAAAVVIALLVASATDADASLPLLAGAGALGGLLIVRPLVDLVSRREPHGAAPGGFAEQLRWLVAISRRFGASFGVAVVSRDDGDSVGAELAERIRLTARDVDGVFGLGDGRAAVLLPEVGHEQARELADRLRRAVSTPTVSIGVALWRRDDEPETIVERAEGALAAARRLGGNQVRGARDHLVLFEEGPLDAARFELLSSLADLVDEREGPDPDHSLAIAGISSELARSMGFHGDVVARAYFAGLLHDLGKVTIPEAVLRKAGPLDQVEWAEMARHPARGAELVERIPAVREAAPGVAAHHERWDGRGYPRRLLGEQIPLEARIVAVADAFVSMRADRPYRGAVSETAALTSIWRETGARYEPVVVSALLALDRDGKLPLGRSAPAGTRERP